MSTFPGHGTFGDSYRVDSSRSMGLGTPLRKAPWNCVRRFGRPSPGLAGEPVREDDGGRLPWDSWRRRGREGLPAGGAHSHPQGTPGTPPLEPRRGDLTARSAMLPWGPCTRLGLQGNGSRRQAGSRKPPLPWANSAAAQLFKATLVMTGVQGHSQMWLAASPQQQEQQGAPFRDLETTSASSYLDISWRRKGLRITPGPQT